MTLKGKTESNGGKKLVVVNPASGRSSFEEKLSYLKNRLAGSDLGYEIFYTEREKSGALSQMISTGNFDEIFVMGGDGTLNLVVNEAGPGEMPISIVSNGTGNDSVKSLHGELNFEKQVDIALHGRIKQFDLGICNGRYFVNGVGIGFDGAVVKEMVERGDKRGRHIDYLITVLRIVGGFRERDLSFMLDGQRFEKKVLLRTISNGTTFGGGFIINPFARTDDGMLDICIINAIKPWKRFWHLPKLKSGSHTSIREAEFHTAARINIDKSDQLVAHLDGEYIGHPPFNIEILKKALSVKVPA
jgi:YegS/Rv2252/BmrU family lipid kinase